MRTSEKDGKMKSNDNWMNFLPSYRLPSKVRRTPWESPLDRLKIINQF